MTNPPSLQQRIDFVGRSIEQTRDFLGVDTVVEKLGSGTVGCLLDRLGQLYVPDTIDYEADGRLRIDDHTTSESERPGFPVIAMIPGEMLVAPNTLITHNDETIMTDIRLMREIDPTLSDELAIEILTYIEAKRRNETVFETRFIPGYSAQVFAANQHFKPVSSGITFRLYQQPVVVFAMQDIHSRYYPNVHPTVCMHELGHVDDYTRRPVVDHTKIPPHEYRLTTEFHAYHISYLGEMALSKARVEYDGLWYRAVKPHERLSVSARVERVRRLHTTSKEPYKPLPGAYEALQRDNLGNIYIEHSD